MSRGCNRAKSEMSHWSMFETYFRRTINVMSVIHYLDISFHSSFLNALHFPQSVRLIFCAVDMKRHEKQKDIKTPAGV